MKVILLADVKKVGRRGEIKEVADGFAQNVLLRQKLALPGTAENLKKIEKAGQQVAEKKALSNSLLAKSIEELRGKTLTLNARANEKGVLFQAIHARQIATEIEKQFGVAIPITSVSVPEIKTKGECSATLEGGGASVTLPIQIT